MLGLQQIQIAQEVVIPQISQLQQATGSMEDGGRIAGHNTFL